MVFPLTAWNIFLLVIAGIVFFVVHNLSIRIAALFLFHDKSVIDKEFGIETLKISAIIFLIALVVSLFIQNYVMFIVISLLTLVLIKQFIGGGLSFSDWDKTVLFWIVWLIVFLIIIGLFALMAVLLARI